MSPVGCAPSLLHAFFTPRQLSKQLVNGQGDKVGVRKNTTDISDLTASQYSGSPLIEDAADGHLQESLHQEETLVMSDGGSGLHL